MNGRQKKKAEKIRRAKLHRLLDQVLDINGLEARSVEETGDKPTAFFWFSGHTGTTNIMVHYTGWDRNTEADFSKNIAMFPKSWHDNADDVIKQLDYIRWRYRV